VRASQNSIQDLDKAVRPVAEREFQMLLAEKRESLIQGRAPSACRRKLLPRAGAPLELQFRFAVGPSLFSRTPCKAGHPRHRGTLFHVTFRQEPGVPAWDPSVETWQVIDAGRVIGRFYLDMHPRPGKYSHAEMMPLLDGIRGKQLPEGVLICNFPRPTADDPGLMEYGDVQTFSTSSDT